MADQSNLAEAKISLLRGYFCGMPDVFTSDKIRDAKKLIDEANKIVVTAHKSPDGDAVGSVLAVKHLLKSLGKDVVAMLPDEPPAFLTWMKDAREIVIFEKDEQKAAQLINEADLVFSLDYNNMSRTGEAMASALHNAKGFFIMIDHHQQPESVNGVVFSDTASCSTGEMIYHFIKASGWQDKIDNAMAECMYCGIMTDSGSFRFPSVTPETHRIVADLIAGGLDHAKVHREVYDTNLLDRLRLVGYALTEKLEVIDESATAIIWLTKQELQRFSYRQGDTEGLVNQALSISGVKLAAFFREGNNEIKISFRSKGNFDVNTFARKNWKGGGHRNAAGGSATGNIVDAIERFKTEVRSSQKEITES